MRKKGLFVSVLLLIVFMLLPLRVCRADAADYSEKVTVTGQNQQFTAVHFHDWSYAIEKQRNDVFDLNHHEQVFLPEKNQFSYLKLFDKATGTLVFRAAVPALTYLWISPDSKYVVGLSKIMLLNPYQLVVFTINGKLLYKEHISSSVAVMTQAELKGFFHEFPSSKAYLLPRTRTIHHKEYIDAFILGMGNVLSERAFSRLFHFSQPNPYSPNFGESVTNFVYWFDETNPHVEMHEENHALFLSLRDPKGKPFRIPLSDTPRA